MEYRKTNRAAMLEYLEANGRLGENDYKATVVELVDKMTPNDFIKLFGYKPLRICRYCKKKTPGICPASEFEDEAEGYQFCARAYVLWGQADYIKE